MALTDIDIINGALNLIGANPISSLDDGTREAQVASVLYDDVYETNLALHPWFFAKVKVKLARLAAVPLNEWSYAFQLPTDMVRLLNEGSGNDYEILEDNLYINNTECEIEYITRIDESKLPKWFKLPLMYSLAANMCVSITSNRSLADGLEAQSDSKLKEAKFINDDQAPAETWTDNPFIDVRGY